MVAERDIQSKVLIQAVDRTQLINHYLISEQKVAKV